MSDTIPPPRAAGRGLVALIALAFVAGLTLMGYAAKRWHWLGTPAAEQAAAAARPATTAPEMTPPLAVAPQVLPQTAAIDPATLASREASLAGQLAALEARTAAVTSDAGAAAAQAGRAEAMLVAAAARRQIDRGEPLGYLEEQLRQRFGQSQPRAVAVAIAAARQPVTLEDLVTGLDARAPLLLSGPQDDLLDDLRRELATLVVLRRVGTPSPLPADRVARAVRLLHGGRVEAARAEVAALPGADAAAAWLVAARRWVMARQALDLIETAALTLPPPAAAPAPTAVTTTTLLP